MLFSIVFQPSSNKEGFAVQTPSHPPPSVTVAVTPAEQRPQSISPVQKARDSAPPSSPLSPLSHHTDSEEESVLEEPQTGLPGEAQNDKNPFHKMMFNSLARGDKTCCKATIFFI